MYDYAAFVLGCRWAIALETLSMASPPIPIWTIYADADKYVVVGWMTSESGPTETGYLYRADTIDAARAAVPEGHDRYDRSLHDEANVVESWI